MNKAQKGFAIIETLLIVAVIGILAGTAYYVWYAKQKTDESLNNSANTSLNVPKDSSIKTYGMCIKSPGSTVQNSYPSVCVTKDGQRFTDTAASGTRFVVINEWGVKFKDDAKLHLLYALRDSNDATFTSMELAEATGGCEDYGGIISRYHENDPVDIKGETAKQVYDRPGNFAYKIGDYYYIYTPPQALCPMIKSTDELNIALQAKTQQAVAAMFKTISASSD